MRKTWNESDIICPFYKQETRNTIQCESIIKMALNITNSFKSAKEKEIHIRNCCTSDYNSCIICQQNYKKYEDNDERK